MSQPIECGGAEDAVVREGVSPFAEVQIRSQDRRRALIPSGNQIMEVFVVGRTKGFEHEVVDDQHRHAHERLELAFVELGRPNCMQLLEQVGLAL